MLLQSLDARMALAIRAFGLAAIDWSILAASPAPSTSGRGLVIALLLVAATIGWLVWTWESHAGRDRSRSVDLVILSGAGGLLIGASPNSAGGAFAFVAIVTGGFRLATLRASALAALAIFTLALSVLIYDETAVHVLAYGLGFLAALLLGSNAKQTFDRAAEAELLLAQVQRSREEQLRAARLEESARVAREIHDVLAHTLAGLTMQLEATSSLLERGAERALVLERLHRAHALAREGLEETRRAVGVLRGEGLAVPEVLRALLAGYEASCPAAETSLQVRGAASELEGPAALALVRVAQEALTNASKHAPGASVRMELEVGADRIVLSVRDEGRAAEAAGALAGSGGGYGLLGMRERAQVLNGSLSAGPHGEGWQVELRLPPETR